MSPSALPPPGRLRLPAHRALWWVIVLTAGIFVLDLATPLGVAEWALYALPVLASSATASRRILVVVAAACTALSMAGIFLSPPGVALELSITNRTIGISTLWIIAAILMRRVRAEAALRDSQDRLHLAKQIARAGSWSFNIENEEFEADETGRAMHGLGAADSVTSLAQVNRLIHPDDLAEYKRQFEGAIRTRGTIDHEYRVVPMDGGVRWIQLQGGVPEGSHYLIGMVQDITARKTAQEAVRQSEAQYRALAQRVESAREEERTAVAREVHDVVGQMLTGMKMDLAWLKNRLPGGDAEGRRHVNDIAAQADRAVQAVRDLATRLRPAALDDIGLAAAIEADLTLVRRRSTLAVHADLPDRSLGLGSFEATTLFRIYQEALTNVIRHAQATDVIVRLGCDGGSVVLEIADNGRGIRDAELRAPASLGLLGMRERAVACGGSIEIRPRDGGGTTLVTRIPRGGPQRAGVT